MFNYNNSINKILEVKFEDDKVYANIIKVDFQKIILAFNSFNEISYFIDSYCNHDKSIIYIVGAVGLHTVST